MFENISKLFKYKWNSEFINSLKPGPNKIAIPESVSQDIKTGFFLMLVGAVVNAINSVLGTYIGQVVVENFVNQFSGKNISLNLGHFGIVTALTSAVLNALIIFLLMSYFTGDKVRKALPYCIMLGISLLALVFSIFGLIGSLSSFYFSFYTGILNLIYTVLCIMALANISVGCIDFCLAANQSE